MCVCVCFLYDKKKECHRMYIKVRLFTRTFFPCGSSGCSHTTLVSFSEARKKKYSFVGLSFLSHVFIIFFCFFPSSLFFFGGGGSVGFAFILLAGKTHADAQLFEAPVERVRPTQRDTRKHARSPPSNTVE